MPCFNEEAAIPLVLPRLIDSLNQLVRCQRISQYEVIVVNDQSTDNSLALLQQFEQIKIVQTEKCPRGYGRALKRGFTQASGDWIGFLDVDNSYRPEDLPSFIDEIEKGSSFFIMGARDFSELGMSWVRGLGNWSYKVLAQKLYGSSLKDVCSGYRFFHKKHLDDVLSVPEEGLDFSIHLTLKMLSRTSIVQIPIQYDPRLGKSKLSVIRDGLAFLKVLLFFRLRNLGALKHSRV